MPSRLRSGPSPRVRGTPPGADWQPRGSAVHPRVCGEHVCVCVAMSVYNRSIPACAGNTQFVQRLARTTDGPSPRVRGTRLEAGIKAAREAGPSPRVRGTLTWWQSWQRSTHGPSPRVRGTLALATRHGQVAPVHPRVCGEHLFLLVGGVWMYGPSPRVRGTRDCRLRFPTGNRSIPACAGNTRRCPRSGQIPTVHPRVCGEHARGVGARAGALRSIPACAGNTISIATLSRAVTGPSPRVRGTRVHDGEGGAVPGPSPRVRGTPSALSSADPSGSVHPRVCGEHAYSVGAE